MDTCRECDAEIPEGANFCQQCGAPQNREAAQALQQYTRRRAEELLDGGETGTESTDTGTRALLDRLGYALGWILVVSGFVVVPNPSSGFLVFGGIVALPPVRRLLGRQLGYTPGMAQMLVISLTSAAIGLGVFVLA
jgi:hypothetical protein